MEMLLKLTVFLVNIWLYSKIKIYAHFSVLPLAVILDNETSLFGASTLKFKIAVNENIVLVPKGPHRKTHNNFSNLLTQPGNILSGLVILANA